MLRRCAMATFALLLGCGPETTGAMPQQSTNYLTLLEAPAYPPIDGSRPEPVPQTRERKRWLFEERVEERELPLLRRMKREEMGNFGGIEWRWRDGPGNGGLGELTGIAYFLRRPEQTLQRFTRNPLFQAAQGDFARTDQDAVVRRWAATIGRDVASEGFYNIQVPTLDVALPRAEFEQQARSKGWRLPANLRLRLDPRAEPSLPAISADLKPLIRAFPQQLRLSGPVPDIATYDAIVIRDGCFFIDEPGEKDVLAEFPLDVGVYRDREGHVAFRPRHADDRRRLGRVGTRLQLGYRSGPRPAPPELARACGAQSIVTITSVDQAAGYGSAWQSIQHYRDRERVSTAEAIRRANACLLAEEQTIADNRLRGGRKQPNQCSELGLITNPVPPPPPKLSGLSGSSTLRNETLAGAQRSPARAAGAVQPA